MKLQRYRFPRLNRVSRWRGFSISVILLVLPLIISQASVLVAPTVVVLSDDNRTGRIIVRNPSTESKEVSVFFRFGLPESDSLGNIYVKLEDSAYEHERSAAHWIRAFPRKIVLPPGAQQTIRFVATPPAGLKPGEYWSRVVVQSQNNQAVPLDTLQEGQITAKLNMIMQTAISLKYRSGDLTSQVQMTGAQAKKSDDKATLLLDLINQGNVSYLGVLECEMVDAKGREMSTNRADIAVYYDLRRKMDLAIPEGEFEEPYEIHVSLSTEGRTDLPSNEVVHGNSIATIVTVE